MYRTRTSAHALSITAGLVAACLLAVPVSTQAPVGPQSTIVNGREAIAGEVLVKFYDVHALDDRLFLEWQVDADESEEVGGRGLRRLHSSWLRTEELVSFLAAQPEVEFVEPNYVLRLAVTPNDPQFVNLWGLLNIGQNVGGIGTPGADIGAAAAWNTSTGSRANVVAVIDTGVDYNHPDLAANIWSAPSSFTVNIGGRSITCAAGTHGFNAITNTCDPMDDHNHGTHVSGTIGASGNNGIGVAGVNWAASIMGLKFLGSNGSGNVGNALNAIEFAIQAKTIFAASGGANVRVLSNSWGGGGFSQAMLDEINKADANGMLFIAAAGNNSSNNDTAAQYPANYNAPNVISVAATDNTDHLASFSNYGAATVHVGAPGVNVLSTVRNNGYSYFSGTSMAAPHVSGAAALLLSACPLTTTTLKSTLAGNVDLVPALGGNTTTGGRVNVYRALQSCINGAISNVSLVADRTAPQPPGTAITWTATPTGGISPYQYLWLVYNGTTWSVSGTWTTSNTFTWTPGAINNGYYVGVWVRSAGNTANAAEKSTAAPFAIATSQVTALGLSANRSSPQPPGTTITWTAAATGGTSPYQYQWLLYNGTTWASIGGWTSSNTLAWTPTQSNSGYYVGVWARSAGNTTNAGERTAAAPFAIGGSSLVTAVTIAPNRTAPQPPGTTITWTATPTGGTAPLQYQWLVYNGTSWSASGTWTTSNTFAWTPVSSNAGFYVGVWVRSAANTANTAESSTAYPFAITTGGVTGLTLTANRAAPQSSGTTITWTATPAGGTAPHQYQWLVYDGASWTPVGGWTTSNTFAWTPSQANAGYYVGVWVRSAGNTANAAERNAAAPFAIF